MIDSYAKYIDIVTMMHAFHTWRKSNIIWGCLDMIEIGKIDNLRLMWVARFGVDTYHVNVSFRRVLLLKENIDTGYYFGSIEAIGIWPTTNVKGGRNVSLVEQIVAWNK